MALRSFLSALGFPGAIRSYLARVYQHIHCHITGTGAEAYVITASGSESYSIIVTATDNTGI
jgi:hypothetical protein